jgi:hypothetical protein
MDNRDVTLINESLEELITNGFIVENKPGKYKPTEIGRAVAASGISLETAKGFLVFLNNYNSSELSGAAVIWQAASTGESGKDEIQLSPQEKRASRYPELLLEAAGCRVEWGPPLIAGKDMELLRSAKRTLIAIDWMEGMPLASIENGFDTSSGVIRRGMERLSWQLGTMASMSGHLGKEEYDTVYLRNLSDSCSVGLPQKSLVLKELLEYGAQRGHITAMVREGIEKPEDIDSLPDEFLERFLPPEILRRVRHKIGRSEYLIHDTGTGLETESDIQTGPPARVTGEDEVISIDYNDTSKPVLNLVGEPMKRRTLIEIHGLRVTITDNSFKILLRLAINLHVTPQDWIHQDELDHLGNTTQMISRLRQEIGPYLKAPILDIIANNGRSGYRLDLPVSQVEINTEGIKRHWNMHFREMVADLSGKSR